MLSAPPPERLPKTFIIARRPDPCGKNLLSQSRLWDPSVCPKVVFQLGRASDRCCVRRDTCSGKHHFVQPSDPASAKIGIRLVGSSRRPFHPSATCANSSTLPLQAIRVSDAAETRITESSCSFAHLVLAKPGKNTAPSASSLCRIIKLPAAMARVFAPDHTPISAHENLRRPLAGCVAERNETSIPHRRAQDARVRGNCRPTPSFTTTAAAESTSHQPL